MTLRAWAVARSSARRIDKVDRLRAVMATMARPGETADEALDRDRPTRGLIRRTDPPPPVAGREPADEPHDPHRSGHPTPSGHRGPCLLPTQARRREVSDGGDALPHWGTIRFCGLVTNLRRRLPTTRGRRMATRSARRGRAPGTGPGGHCGGLINPARSTCPRISTLWISHFPDPRARRYNPPRTAGRSPRITFIQSPLENRGERYDASSLRDRSGRDLGAKKLTRPRWCGPRRVSVFRRVPRTIGPWTQHVLCLNRLAP
jgi:hypothetical protein